MGNNSSLDLEISGVNWWVICQHLNLDMLKEEKGGLMFCIVSLGVIYHWIGLGYGLYFLQLGELFLRGITWELL